jgi:hypothetical protein
MSSLTPERITAICGTKTGANVPHDLREAVNSAPTWKLLSAQCFRGGIGERILHAVHDSYPGRPMESLDVNGLQSVEGSESRGATNHNRNSSRFMEYLSGLERTEEPRRQATENLMVIGLSSPASGDKALNKLIEDEGGLIVTGGKKATILVVANDDFKAASSLMTRFNQRLVPSPSNVCASY